MLIYGSYKSMVYSSHPFIVFAPTAWLQAKTVTADRRNEATLIQRVYGKFGCHYTLVRNVSMKICIVSADHPDYLMLFREHVSRRAAGKGRAVLEGVGLDAEVIEACFQGHPLNEEETVQAGLNKWSAGQGRQPPTWKVLLGTMDYANIARWRIDRLNMDLGLH